MSFNEKTEKNDNSKPKNDSSKEEKPQPDIESCIKQKVSEGMTEEEAKGYCEKQVEQEEKAPEEEAPKEEGVPKEEGPSQEEKPPVEEIQDPNQLQQDPNQPPQDPNQLKDPNAPPQDPNAPPQAPSPEGQGFGQYQNFEQCLQDQLGQGLNSKDAVVNCAAQLLQTMETNGQATPVPPNQNTPSSPPFAASYNVGGVEINIAEFPGGFEQCVMTMKDKGMEKEAAISKCQSIFEGKINKVPTAAQPVEVQTAKKDDDKLYIRAFLLDSSLNQNFWGVNNASIDQRISSFIGRPLVLTEDFGHPELSDMAFGHALQYQDVYRIGTIIDVVQTAKSEHDKNKKIYYAIIEVTDAKAKEAFKNHKLPLYVSPAVAKMNAAEQDGKIEEWLGMHLALVDKPAFGVQKAQITGSCSGEEDKCVMHLRQAKIDKYGYGNCGFCVYQKLTSILTAKKDTPKSVNSSLTSENTQEQLTMSKTDENKDIETKLAEAKQEIVKAEEAKKQSKPAENYEELGLMDGRIVRYETENTILKANLKELRKEYEKLNEENNQLKTSIRRAEISNIVTAEVYPDEVQRKKMIDMFTDKKLTPEMVAEMYESMKGSVKVAKTSGYDARVPVVKTAKNNQGDIEGVSLAKEVRNMFIKGGNA